MKLNALVLYYLQHNTGVVGDFDRLDLKEGDNLAETLKKFNQAGIVSLGACTLSAYWWNRSELGFKATDFPDAERFLKMLNHLLYPGKKHYIAIKMETGGLHTWVHEKRCRGSEYYPILQLTLKVGTYASKTWYINPSSTANHIKDSVKRILANRQDVLLSAVNHGLPMRDVHTEIKAYLESCHVTPNDPNKQQRSQLVCMNEAFIRSFVNDQLQILKDYISPKYIDLVAYNNVMEAAGEQDHVIYPQYTETPDEYVETLLNVVLHNPSN